MSKELLQQALELAMRCPWSEERAKLADTLRSALAAPAMEAEPCYCDRMQIGVPGVSCGDCPRDYKPAAPAPAVPESPSLWLPSESMTRWGENWWSYESMKAVADQNYQRGFAHGVRFADESLTAKDIIPDAAPAVREPLIDEMDAVASKYAHKLALDLECVLSDYNGKWWDTAMQTIGEYRMAMNRIHEQESPTHMGEPVLPKHGIGGGGNG